MRGTERADRNIKLNHKLISEYRILNAANNYVRVIEQLTEMTNPLTKREIEVLKLVKEGFLSKEISDKLTISFHTVNTHRQRVIEKLGVNNSMEAVVLASKLGLL